MRQVSNLLMEAVFRKQDKKVQDKNMVKNDKRENKSGD